MPTSLYPSPHRTSRAALVVANRPTRTNLRLRAAFAASGLEAAIVPAAQATAIARPGDLVLGRLDVLPSLDGAESGVDLLRHLRAAGADVRNGSDTLIACHDKLSTALILGAAGIRHPRSAYVGAATAPPGLLAPFVVKPRFGSWGRDVQRCDSTDELTACLETVASEPWFARHGALVQELIDPRGYDLRILVAGGEVAGAIRRTAAPGEWRTNVALGATRHAVDPPLAARMLAIRAAAAVGADLVGVDLLPERDGWCVLELNGAVDFTDDYALDDGDVFDRAVGLLVGVAERRVAAPVPA
jgi:RimK family alpha-L-glutamate ligase